MSEIKYEIVQKLGVLSTPALSRVEGSASGWSKELNLISWNDREPPPLRKERGAGIRIWGKGRVNVKQRRIIAGVILGDELKVP